METINNTIQQGDCIAIGEKYNFFEVGPIDPNGITAPIKNSDSWIHIYEDGIKIKNHSLLTGAMSSQLYKWEEIRRA